MTALYGPELYRDTLPGGTHWSMRMRRGTCLKITDSEGGANVGMLFYNPEAPLERYNAPDTLKCQHTFKLSEGHCLYSDMGRIFASIVEDSCGWHDTVGGNLSEAAMASKWQVKSYQSARNDWTISGEHAFSVELAKHGLGPRDLAANLNFFSRVYTDNSGTMCFDPDNSRKGGSVVLRFEMDTLVILHTCPHAMNTSDHYPKRSVDYSLHEAAPVNFETDLCRNHCDENKRGFENNRLYYLGAARGFAS